MRNVLMAVGFGKKLLTKHAKNPQRSLKASPQNLMLEQKATITEKWLFDWDSCKEPPRWSRTSPQRVSFHLLHKPRVMDLQRQQRESPLLLLCLCWASTPRAAPTCLAPRFHAECFKLSSRQPRGTRQSRATSKQPTGALSSAAAAAIWFQAEQRLPFSCK